MTPAAFIERWSGREGGAERANYALFLTEMTQALDLPTPEPADSQSGYRFEFPVEGDFGQPLRIDLYKRGHFILEAKQSRLAVNQELKPKHEAIVQPDMFGHAPILRRGRRAGQDADMGAAFRQARDYAHRLPPGHDRPPFVIACDVGRSFEFYADFTLDGRYRAFPDDRRRVVPLEALVEPEVQTLFHRVWETPHDLDPARERVRITREVAGYLADVSRGLEERGVAADRAASFLGRILFAMFAQSAGLLPENSLTDLLTRCRGEPGSFRLQAADLFQKMDAGGFAPGLGQNGALVRRFNGSFYHEAEAFDLKTEEIGALLLAANRDWKQVEPAIFGTLLEQALDPAERARLGAHYTPRPYVERLVEATVMQPLREDWAAARAASLARKEAGDREGARRELLAFHEQLSKTRVLDPACGTGNFLYVALELIKTLEGEVEAAEAELEAEGEAAALEALTVRGVDPRSFFGLELNPRAARIAELVLWIGYLQTQRRRHGDAYEPRDPVLEAFETVNPRASRRRPTDTCVDALMTHDGPVIGGGGTGYPNPRRTPWPEAEFIVGNPPFIGGKDIRAELDGAYAEALWRLNPHMDRASDFVMYWWDRAADILTRKGSPLRRFGFVTTNSITQVFQRRTLSRWMGEANPNKTPLSLAFAIGDHPWTKATREAAAVRIAMTVARPGRGEGRLFKIATGSEADLDTDSPRFDLTVTEGLINADLTVGVDVTRSLPLKANEGVCSPGVKLHGAGFVVTPAEASHLGLGRPDRAGLEAHIRPYANGRDITARPRGRMVIDLYGLSAEDVLARFPEVYQHVAWTVRYDKDEHGVERVDGRGRKTGREWNNRPTYRDNWWVFGEPRSELRPALSGIRRFIATVETAKHRTFQFIDAETIPDNMVIALASDDGGLLAVLSSRVHYAWVAANCGLIGVASFEQGHRYTKSRCFDPFPFPALTEARHAELARAGEALDAFRRARLAEHPDMTLTQLYNALEAHRTGRSPDGEGDRRMSDDEARDFRRGSVLALADLHDGIDRLTLDAYGLPADADDTAVLAHMVALNAARAAEEATGEIRWLRPAYQIPRFAPRRVAGAQTGRLIDDPVAAAGRIKWPSEDRSRLMLIRGALSESAGPQPVEAVAARFTGRKVAPEVARLLSALERDGQVRRSPAGYALLRAA